MSDWGLVYGQTIAIILSELNMLKCNHLNDLGLKSQTENDR